jgi:hypothetical protein
MDELINEIRFYHFISGVLVNQQADTVCGRCRAFVNTTERMKEGTAELESFPDKTGLSAEILILLKETRNRLNTINLPEDSEGQKKAGNCRMPEGVCFVKSSKAVLSRVREQSSP